MTAGDEPRSPWRAALAALVLGLFWTLPWSVSPPERTWGWDESMHAELPAARMLVAARDGELRRATDVLLDCNQYPFVWPVALAFVQSTTGISELAARVAGTFAWALALFGLYLLGAELARAQRRPHEGQRRNDALVPWLAMALGALSPLALAYAGTLFLEVPFTCVAVFALVAWLRRTTRAGEPGAARRELAAGALLTAGFFTKWNYGLLLGFACALDWLVELALTRGARRAFLARAGWLALVPALGFAWWLALPLPGGLDVAARHRDALADFLRGNLDGPPTPWPQRLLYWTGAFAPTARFLALELVALAVALRELARPGARLLAIALLAAGLPVWLHPFQLERFLIPEGPAIWSLAALGLARLLPRAPRAKGIALAALALVTLSFPGGDVVRIADALGLLRNEPEVRASQVRTLRGWSRLDPLRPIPTAGLRREEARAILELVAEEARPTERVGWLGLSSELSPAAIHLALYRASGTRERLLSDSIRPMDVTWLGVDPQWDDEELARYALDFDVIFATEPPDLRDRAPRRFVAGYRERLLGALGWEARELGEISIERSAGDPRPVRLLACRPKR